MCENNGPLKTQVKKLNGRLKNHEKAMKAVQAFPCNSVIYFHSLNNMKIFHFS